MVVYVQPFSLFSETIYAQKIPFYHATKCKYAKISKKVRFCRFYGFLCKNAVPCLSPENTFVLRQNFAIYYVSSIYKAINGR